MNITDMLWNKNNSNAYFDSLYSNLSKKVPFKSFSVRVLSLESKDYSIRYDCNNHISSKRIDKLTLNHSCTSETNIGKEDTVFVYVVEENFKLYDDSIFEVVITFRSRLYNDNKPISKIYLACETKFQDDMIALFNDNAVLGKWEVSLQLLKMSNDNYEKVFLFGRYFLRYISC